MYADAAREREKERAEDEIDDIQAASDMIITSFESSEKENEREREYCKVID